MEKKTDSIYLLLEDKHLCKLYLQKEHDSNDIIEQYYLHNEHVLYEIIEENYLQKEAFKTIGVYYKTHEV